MARLQGIVWPEIRQLAQSRIETLGQEGREAVVLEAAVLLEAGWDDMCDELWVVQVPPDIARYVKRSFHGHVCRAAIVMRVGCCMLTATHGAAECFTRRYPSSHSHRGGLQFFAGSCVCAF